MAWTRGFGVKNLGIRPWRRGPWRRGRVSFRRDSASSAHQQYLDQVGRQLMHAWGRGVACMHACTEAWRRGRVGARGELGLGFRRDSASSAHQQYLDQVGGSHSAAAPAPPSPPTSITAPACMGGCRSHSCTHAGV
jgi:hypothetical protein